MAFNFSRYSNRNIIRNSSPEYLKQFSERNISFVDQFTSPNFSYPTEEVLGQLTVINEVWQVGSRFYKLADKYYGDPSLWWILPWFNKKPLESDFNGGDVILIPKPLNVVLSIFE